MRLDQAAQQIVDKLAAAGVAAAVDPRNLDPPAVWVQLLEHDNTAFPPGHYKATWNLTAVVPDAGTMEALAQLGRLCEALMRVFTTIKRGTTVPLILPGGPDPMPAIQYQLTLLCADDTPPPPPPERET